MCCVVVCISVLIIDVFSSFFFFKQKTAYEMRISDWSSDVCSSDLTRSRQSEMERSRCRHRHRVNRSVPRQDQRAETSRCGREEGDRKSVVWGESVSVRGDLGGRRIIHKQTTEKKITTGARR